MTWAERTLFGLRDAIGIHASRDYQISDTGRLTGPSRTGSKQNSFIPAHASSYFNQNQDFAVIVCPPALRLAIFLHATPSALLSIDKAPPAEKYRKEMAELHERRLS